MVQFQKHWKISLWGRREENMLCWNLAWHVFLLSHQFQLLPETFSVSDF